MKLITRQILALFVALALVATGGPAVVAQDADIGPAGRPPIGTAVPYISDEGNEIGLITITEVVDPYTDADATSPPDAGYRYVEVGLQVEATGRRPLEFYPYYIYIQDRDGFLYSQTYIFRDSALTEERPDFSDNTVAAGDTATGYLYFSVFEDAEIVRILYTDYSTRLIFLADLTAEGSVITPGGGGAGPEGTAEPEVPDDGDDSRDGGDSGDTGAGGDLALSDEDCEDVLAWYEDSEKRFAGLEEAFEPLVSGNLEPDAARELADQLEDLAEEQADSDAPEAAQEANDAFVALLQAFADALNDYADAVEGGTDPTTALIAAFTDVQPLADETDALMSELSDACGIEVE